MLENLAIGFAAAGTPTNLLFIAIGTVIGLWIGVLPGLGATAAMAILIPFTFTMEPLAALLMLASISVAGAFGGSITSILLNIPGDASSAATAYDGYPMAQQGRARVAMGLSTGASLFAGIVGVMLLAGLSEPIAKAALTFGPAEYFALGMLGIAIVAAASAGNTVKGLIMGALGLSVSFVGLDSVLGFPRFTYGSIYLEAGIGFVPVTIGLFAITEVMFLITQGGTISRAGRLEGSLWEGFIGTLRYPLVLLQSTSIGALIGIIPGVGATAANFLAYSAAQTISKTPERFGKGAPEGVIAPEASNNSCIPTSFIPALTLGIPGGASAAILLVAVTIHGLRPGALLFQSNPELVYGFFSGLLIGTVMAAILCIAMIPLFAMITVIRIEILAPLLIVVSLAGAYAASQSLADVFVAIAFGIIGYIARRRSYPVICLVLGLILGDLIEKSFHQALMISGRDYTIFLTRPMSAVILGLAVALVVWPGFKRRVAQKGED
ncbi:MAG: hypothetical protein FJX67_14700 [Alphaproteobacteria bacterium]|nr:hypothetical protein [Alphaproteobacteria bacterium]